MSGSMSHFRSDERQPCVADHSHSWAQARRRAARMVFKIILHILLYHGRQLFNCKRGHILGNVYGRHVGLEESKNGLLRKMKAMRGRIALLKHFVRNPWEACSFFA